MLRITEVRLPLDHCEADTSLSRPLDGMLLGWILPASALLLLLGNPIWPYFALVGSGVFIYFSVLIILSRIYLKRSGRKVGRVSSERTAYFSGGIWIVSSMGMMILAIATLSG